MIFQKQLSRLRGAQKNYIVIQASSAGFEGGDSARISINDVAVEVEANENNHYRGLHIVVISPGNGEVQWARAYDTHMDKTAMDQFIGAGLQKNSIVVAACRDDCVARLSELAKTWFAEMGSQEIWKLGYR